jgi:hypothetical protein
MSNRRFEMYQYSHIIIQLRNGNSIRALSKAKLADRKKLRKIKQIAEAQGWLDSKGPMPDDEVLARFFKKTQPSQKSLLDRNCSYPYAARRQMGMRDFFS